MGSTFSSTPIGLHAINLSPSRATRVTCNGARTQGALQNRFRYGMVAPLGCAQLIMNGQGPRRGRPRPLPAPEPHRQNGTTRMSSFSASVDLPPAVHSVPVARHLVLELLRA